MNGQPVASGNEKMAVPTRIDAGGDESRRRIRLEHRRNLKRVDLIEVARHAHARAVGLVKVESDNTSYIRNCGVDPLGVAGQLGERLDCVIKRGKGMSLPSYKQGHRANSGDKGS